MEIIRSKYKKNWNDLDRKRIFLNLKHFLFGSIKLDNNSKYWWIKIDIQKIEFKEKGLHSEDAIFSKSIAKLISSYTQSFNKVYQRSGALFESPFKRINIDSEEYLRNLILYIHQNPDNFEQYKFSSYKSIISQAETKIERQIVLDVFGGKDNFILTHRNIKSDIL